MLNIAKKLPSIGIKTGNFYKSNILKSSKLMYSSSSKHFAESVKLTFIEGEDGDPIEIDAEIGKKMLDVCVDHDIDIEGACGGELACSTCHVIFEKNLYDTLSEKTEEEEDMLDLAWGLTDTSRLCCQIEITKDMEGAKIVVPLMDL